MIEYTLELENDVLLNLIPFIEFLRRNENSDIRIIVNQESHDLRSSGVYDILELFNFKSVTIVTSNAVEQHPRYSIINTNWSYWLTRTQLYDFNNDYEWNQRKIFGCFYGRASAPRLGIASYLVDKYDDLSLVKVQFNNESEDDRKKFELTKIFSWDSTRLKALANFLENKHKYQSDHAAYNYTDGEYNYASNLNLYYKDIFVDIISEAVVRGHTFYPTEKFARAVLCKKSFIVMSSMYYLRYLTQLGFKTFNQFWNEDYDDLSGKDRYFKILQLIDHISGKSMSELMQMKKDMDKIVEHNYNLLVDQKFLTNIKKIDMEYSIPVTKVSYEK